MKKIFIDTETSGLDPKRHALLELAAILDINGWKVDKFNMFIKPFDGQELNPEAMNVNGFDLGNPKFKPPITVFEEFNTFLKKHINPYDKRDKAFLIGYNVRFDYDFLSAFFVNNGSKYINSWFWWPPIDVMVLAAQCLMKTRSKMEGFKQSNVGEQLGIKLDESQLHGALYDTELCRSIYYKVIGGSNET